VAKGHVGYYVSVQKLHYKSHYLALFMFARFSGFLPLKNILGCVRPDCCEGAEKKESENGNSLSEQNRISVRPEPGRDPRCRVDYSDGRRTLHSKFFPSAG
jgi:hypothetical protein